MQSPKTSQSGFAGQPFPPLHIIRSGGDVQSTPHVLTHIVLHGRGSNGSDHETELFELTEPKNHLRNVLPLGTRFIFPTAPMRPEPVFRDEMNQWFCIESLDDVDRNQRTQAPGIAETIKYLDKIIDAEVDALGGDSSKVFLGGISQGGAVGMWVVLHQTFLRKRRLGGFWAVSTWLPYSTLFTAGDNLIQLVSDMCVGEEDKSVLESLHFLQEIVAATGVTHELTAPTNDDRGNALAPILLGHGVDDSRINISLGRNARDCLKSLGQDVGWQEYKGADVDGHWFKEPEALRDIGNFLARSNKNIT